MLTEQTTTVNLAPSYCNPDFQFTTKLITLSTVRMAINTYDLLGTLATPRNSWEFHRKKSNIGRITAAFPQLCPSERIRDGIVVRAGYGLNTVRSSEMNSPSPIAAGISNPKPATEVIRMYFEVELTIPPESYLLRRTAESPHRDLPYATRIYHDLALVPG